MERTDSRLIRVFLSSTFVDFQEERSLLVQQVFPSLRRRARSREVEIVDVDLRWGVTAEQTERGETLPLCLGEIDRCRPYFISLLGERYGWVPPPDYYKPELLERQPWLKERMGGASVTELEILHGVLRNPEMAGHAFFYLRDPAYAQAQSEPGWVAESPSERERLAALKAQIRASGFPVAEGLPNPQAIAERIEPDLWQLIESRFPEQEPADALERENRRHSDYRGARTGLYLGGGPAIEQLERWVADGEERILITGESGAGKSALIANWLEAHQRNHPQDLVHAHHLGCTNDASAVRPLLGRLIDTASKLLLQEQQISEAIQMPQDWWELVFKVGEVFALLSSWCKRQGRRWILVLDGLDHLAEDDQQALPWIPATIPPGIHVVASALDCPARTILQERQYRIHEIGPLGKAEQQQLIERYLSRYTKQLESGLQQQILEHPLAGSPLFLKVLLEELRQCAWFDNLQEHVAFYLSAESIDGLYAKVLERLENNGHGEATRKALTALWASRAGLSEEELLAITGLAPLQWAPIDLVLEQSFGRNRNLLMLDQDYLRRAVQNLYLPNEEARLNAHGKLADWFGQKASWDERKAEELPWQLMEAGRAEDLRTLLLSVGDLYELVGKRSNREVINYWLSIKTETGTELDDLIAKEVEEEIQRRKEEGCDQACFVDRIASLLDEGALFRKLLLRLRVLSLELQEAAEQRNQHSMLTSLFWLALVHTDMGNFEEAEPLYLRCLEACELLLGPEHPETLRTIGKLAVLFQFKGDYKQAESYYTRCVEANERMLGPEHPTTLSTVGDLAVLFQKKGDYKKAETHFQRCLVVRERLLGSEHSDTLATINNLAGLLLTNGDYEQAEAFFRRCLEAYERLLGPEHPSTLTTVENLAVLIKEMGDYQQAETHFKNCLLIRERRLEPEHPDTLITVGNLGNLYSEMGDYEQAEVCFIRCLTAQEKLLGPEHPDTLITFGNLGNLYCEVGRYEQAEVCYMSCLEAQERLLGPKHPDTLITVSNLGILYSKKGDYEKAEDNLKHCLLVCEQLLGPEHPDTLTAVNNLAVLFCKKGEYQQAEAFYNRCLQTHLQLLGPEHPDTLISVNNLAVLFQDKGDYEKAEANLKHCLVIREQLLGPEHPDTLTSVNNLAFFFQDRADYMKAEAFYNRCLEARERLLGPEHPDTLASVNNLAGLFLTKGDYEQAEACYTRCLEARERLLGPEHPDSLTTVNNMAILFEGKADYMKAEAFYNRCLEARERLLGPEHPDTLASVNNLAGLFLAKGDYEQAEACYTRCLEARERLLGPEHPKTLNTVGNLAILFKEKADYLKAEAFYNRCLEARERLLGPEHPDTLIIVYGLAELLSKQERHVEAIPLRRRELVWYRRENGNTDPGTLSSINGLANDLSEAGEYKEAESLFRELVSACHQVLDPGNFDIGRAMGGLAKTLEMAGKLEEALDFAQQALAHRLEHEGTDAWWTNCSRLNLARVLHKLERSYEAIKLLDQLERSMNAIQKLDEEDECLLVEALDLRHAITDHQ